MMMGKWLFDNLLVDCKGLEFYHRHREFLRMLGENPPLSASFAAGYRVGLLGQFPLGQLSLDSTAELF